VKILEGTVAAYHRKAGASIRTESFNINTKNILFSSAAAPFEGLDKIIAKRVSQNPMGLGADIRGKRITQPDAI